MLFIGIDLAWSPRNRTGGAIIREHQLLTAVGTVESNRDIVEFIANHLHPNEGAVVAVDAPLRVPNLTGARTCDRDLSSDWRAYEAGALPANRQLLTHEGEVRGEVLVDLLHTGLGFVETAPIPQQGRERYLCEIFPHPAHVSLFQLDKTLKYKAKPGRSLSMRRTVLQEYQQLLSTLATATPPVYNVQEVVTEDISTLRGQALKAYEDTLDAITCAYTALYLWTHGPAQTLVYGNVAEGHILTPPLPVVSA